MAAARRVVAREAIAVHLAARSHGASQRFLASDGRCPRLRDVDDACRRSALRSRLMKLYLVLSAYPEVPDVLTRLKTAGMKFAILSNGTPTMLQLQRRMPASPTCSMRCLVCGGSESLQAASFRLPASVSARLKVATGQGLLCVVERLGCLLGQGLWLSCPVVQPFGAMPRENTGDAGRRNRYARRAARHRSPPNALG